MADKTRKVILVMTAVLGMADIAGPIGLAFAQPATVQAQAEVEGRIVNVNADLIELRDGTTVRIPPGGASLAELKEGVMVKVRYEVKNNQNIATAVQIMEAPGGGRK